MRKLPEIKSSGQALPIIVLIMAVALTIGLAVTSRTITDIEISEQTREAARAFSAAEAGIEEALVGIGETTFKDDLEAGVSYTATKTEIGAGVSYVFPQTSGPDEVRTLWLAEHDTLNGFYDYDELEILWGNVGTDPAIEISLYYQDGSDFKVTKFLFDPNEIRDPENYFCHPNGDNCENVKCGGADNTFCTSEVEMGEARFQYQVILKLADAGVVGAGKTPLFARIRFLYTSEAQKLGVRASGNGVENFPSQGVQVTSVGETEMSTRKVEVVRLHPAPPGIFDFLLYSEINLSK